MLCFSVSDRETLKKGEVEMKTIKKRSPVKHLQ